MHIDVHKDQPHRNVVRHEPQACRLDAPPDPAPMWTESCAAVEQSRSDVDRSPALLCAGSSVVMRGSRVDVDRSRPGVDESWSDVHDDEKSERELSVTDMAAGVAW